jgi:hypothetical protein
MQTRTTALLIALIIGLLGLSACSECLWVL